MKFKILAVSFLALQACADLNSGYPSYPSGSSYPSGGGYPNQYPQYPNNGYPNTGYPSGGYPNNGYPGGYPSGGYYPPPQQPPTYDCRYYGNCPGSYNPPPRRNDNNNNNGHHHGNQNNNNNNSTPYIPPPVVIPPPSNSTGSSITPNCPSGTVYTGRTCKITDSSLKKPGGDGNINPCPKGMWVSNGTCVGK